MSGRSEPYGDGLLGAVGRSTESISRGQGERAPEGDFLYSRDYEVLLGDAARAALEFGWRRILKRIVPPLEAAADVACGTGRFVPRLCTVARRVYAVDISPAMLAQAQARAAQCDLRVLMQDMRSLKLPERTGLITCRFASLNYLLTGKDLRRAFAAVARSLVPGGIYAFDVILHPEHGGPPRSAVEDAIGPSGRSRWHYAIDPASGRTATRIEWIDRRGNPVARQTHRQQWHRPQEVSGALRAAGLVPIDVAAMPEGGPGNWFQVIARKPGTLCK